MQMLIANQEADCFFKVFLDFSKSQFKREMNCY